MDAFFMKPGHLDLPTIWRGCDWGPVTFKWKDHNGVPISLATFRPLVRSLNINLNPSITDAAGGVVILSLTREQTASLKLGVESWDWVWEHLASGVVDYRFPPFISGKVPIAQPVTKFGVNGDTPDDTLMASRRKFLVKT
jgi:hypothetical protein